MFQLPCRLLFLMRGAFVILTAPSEVDALIYFQDLSNLTSTYYIYVLGIQGVRIKVGRTDARDLLDFSKKGEVKFCKNAIGNSGDFLVVKDAIFLVTFPYL